MTQPTIFISYSHKDEKEKDQLLSHLGVLSRAGLVEVWSDDRIRAGADWQAEINQAMAQARVAILLISANFLTSDFILTEEVPALLQRREGEGLVIFPVIAKACAWKAVDWLARMQVRPNNGRPVWREAGRYVDEELATIAEEVAAIVEDAASGPDPASIVTIMGQYAPDKGAELSQEAGPKALKIAREMFGLVLERAAEVDPRTSLKYPDNPEGYKTPLTDVLDELLKAQPDFATRLEALLEQYEQAAREHAAAPGDHYQATLTGSGVLVQGKGAIGIKQGDQGQVIIGSSVGGDVLGPGASKKDDE